MILLVGNFKGGTGKSTISFNLAVWSAYNLRRALIIDTDPLHTIANLLNVRKAQGYEPVLYSLVAKESELSKEVERVKDLFDDIIVDIAAGDIVGFQEALKAADKVLIPLLPGQADVWALNDVMKLIRAAQKKRPELKVMAVINKADTNPRVLETKETGEILKQLEGVEPAPTRIGYRVIMRRSIIEGLGVEEWAPKSKAAKEVEILARAVFEVD